MNRDHALEQIVSRQRPYDIVVIGGGATGAGIAVDAASRGLDVALLEARDFGSSTSSRSTKIIHGGVRYLAQGRIGLVREALRERAYLLRNAPHLVHPIPFVVPVENTWEALRYFSGLHLYDALAGRHALDRCAWLSAAEIRRGIDGIAGGKLRGGMRYYDGQFDDARLLVNLVDTAVGHGAAALNYAPVIEFGKDMNGRLHAATFRDEETGETHDVRAAVFVNATGAASDEVLRLDDDAHGQTIMPSQGAHIVVAREFLPGRDALLMPRTPDGRVMFAIPWLGHVLIGTTDTPLTRYTREPTALPQEIDMILEVAGRYLSRPPGRGDILSTFAGIRPLVNADSAATTAHASREHRIEILPSGLISITGGKWTTYRLMAEQCVDVAVRQAGIEAPVSRTASLRLRASPAAGAIAGSGPYGTDASALAALERDTPGAGERLHDALPYHSSECTWAIRREMARTIEDVLARRLRALFLNARAAREMAPAVGRTLQRELGLDASVIAKQSADFEKLARRYENHDAERG